MLNAFGRHLEESRFGRGNKPRGPVKTFRHVCSFEVKDFGLDIKGVRHTIPSASVWFVLITDSDHSFPVVDF